MPGTVIGCLKKHHSSSVLKFDNVLLMAALCENCLPFG